MKWIASALAGLMFLLLAACAAGPERTHFPARANWGSSAHELLSTAIPSGSSAPFSSAVMVGNTLYVSGAIDFDPINGKLGSSAEESAKFALDALKKSVETAGMTMDDLVWVQVFCTDLSYFPTFNAVYRSYFHGELPARAFLGVDHLLANGHFEVMGIAVRKGK